MLEQETQISERNIDLVRTLKFVAFAAYAGLVLSLPFRSTRDYDSQEHFQHSRAETYGAMTSEEEPRRYKILSARGMGISFD